VNGQEYVSTWFYLFGSPPANVLVREYPAGRRFHARYRSGSPAMTVVEPGPMYSRVLVVSSLFIAFALAGIVFNLFKR
jgi:hypothetical protein